MKKWIILVCVIAYARGAPTSEGHDHKEEVAGGSGSSGSSLDSNTLGESGAAKEPVRRTVTYDQRQEGKFNVRADLENFVIVFVPSSPSQGMNLLELLSQMRRTQSKHANKKRIHSIEKDSNTIEVHKEPPHFSPVDQFIEGRTPYRVDINSEPSALSHLHPEVVKTEQVTSSPLLKLIKPAQSLTIEQPTVHITEGNKRVSRSLSASDSPFATVDSNSVAYFGAGSTLTSSGDGQDQDDFFSNQALSSPYLRQLTDPIHSFDSLVMYNNNNDDENNGYMSDDWRLLGQESTAEACGPEMRRDSYGICRFYPTNF